VKYLSSWVCAFLSGAAATAIRSLPICSREAQAPERVVRRDKVVARPGRTLGLALGIGFGVGVALLLAPKSGADTRSMIAKKAREGTGYLKQQVNDLSDAVEN